MKQDQWTTRRNEVEQALNVARETKALALAIRAYDNGHYARWGEKWESESDVLIASFEYFLSGNVRDCYVFAAWIDTPQGHLNDMKRTMRLFDVDVDTFFTYQPMQLDLPVQIEQQTLF